MQRHEDTRAELLDKNGPLTTDEHVLSRAKLLLGTAMRRQLWFMFLDGDNIQLPLLMPTDVPRSPNNANPADLARFIRGVIDEADASTIIVALERRGSDEITSDDRAWFRLVREACAMIELPQRGPVLCHTGGVRWVAAEDL